MSRSILIVDDSPDIQALLKVRLADEGAVLHQTLDPMQALALALKYAPDLILLDVTMPGRSGFEVCKELKANAQTASIPIIFLSGKLDQATKVAGLDLGAVDYVTKPFDPAELRARVRSALRTKLQHDQLIALARVDELTGIWNRAYFESRLEQELASALHTRKPISLIMFDVDHLRQINDKQGQPFGDMVLRTIAQRLQSALRGSDIACRHGGGVFAVILPAAEAGAASIIAERIRQSIARIPMEAGPRSITVQVSLGFATSEDPDLVLRPTPPKLLASAMAAMHEAKRGGRNRVCRKDESMPSMQ